MGAAVVWDGAALLYSAPILYTFILPYFSWFVRVEVCAWFVRSLTFRILLGLPFLTFPFACDGVFPQPVLKETPHGRHSSSEWQPMLVLSEICMYWVLCHVERLN